LIQILKGGRDVIYVKRKRGPAGMYKMFQERQTYVNEQGNKDS
jgi:hypothetical protein